MIATITLARAIALEATLSFLGVGVPVTQPSLGMLISNGFEFLLSGSYWISFFPGVALAIAIVGINLAGDQLRDVLNPRNLSDERGAPALSVRDLRTHFFTKEGVASAVDGVDFDVAPGEILGLVGESGSGKTVTGFSILGLIDPPGRIVEGSSIRFAGEELTTAKPERLRAIRGAEIAMIFQDPMMTLNPVLRVDTQMIETVQAHLKVSRAEARARARAALVQVGIASPDERLRAYPHQFSGGMRQRVAIAIALLHKPKLIVADEPTTALDVTIQGQILFEMQRLCRESNTALIWITHDLAVVAGLADRIAVMYAGRIVEMGRTADIIERPMHPYTKGLIGSVPSQNTRGHPSGADPRHDTLSAETAGRLRVQGALPHRHRQMQRDAGAGGPSAGPSRALLAGRGVSHKGFTRQASRGNGRWAKSHGANAFPTYVTIPLSSVLTAGRILRLSTQKLDGDTRVQPQNRPLQEVHDHPRKCPAGRRPHRREPAGHPAKMAPPQGCAAQAPHAGGQRLSDTHKALGFRSFARSGLGDCRRQLGPDARRRRAVVPAGLQRLLSHPLS